MNSTAVPLHESVVQTLVTKVWHHITPCGHVLKSPSADSLRHRSLLTITDNAAALGRAQALAQGK